MNIIFSFDLQAFTCPHQGDAEVGTIRNRLGSSTTHSQHTLEQLGEHKFTFQMTFPDFT